MATKDDCLSFKEKGFGDHNISGDQYRNLNLNNQIHICIFEEIFHPKNIEFDSKKSQNYDLSDSNDLREKKVSNSWNKCNKQLSSNRLNIGRDFEEKEEFKKAKTANNSTLSLHIAAYENSVEDTNDAGGCEKESKSSGMAKKWETLYHFVNGSTSIIQNPFEFPRQQKDKASRPEVMQFSASQRLLNPNQTDENISPFVTKKDMENIQLSENFFQEFAEDAHFAEPQPVLQILQSRKIEAATICLRLRCSDGVFSYIHCGFDKAIAEKAENEIPDDPSKLPVIKVLAYKVLASQDKNTFIITDYDLISIDMPKIGNPKGHTGDAGTFRGIGDAKRKLDENAKASAGTPTPKKMAKTEGGAVMPINGLSPYVNGRWRIAGIVTGIEQMRQIQSKKGPMKVFSFVLNDRDGQSIKIASFAETAEKFFPQLEENGSYYVSGSQNCIKPANKRFNSTGHDYEITLSHDSVIEAAEKQSYEAPKFVLKQTSLDKLSSLSGQYADILAVIDKVEDPVNVKKKDNTETYRRNIQLIDQSATSIALTLWGVQAEGFSGAEGQIIGIKNAFIREYNGTYSVAVNSGCRIELDPESKDTEILHQWYEGERPNAEVKSISTQANAVSNNLVDELRLFSFFSIPNLFVDPQRGIYFNNVGIVSQLRPDNVLYMSCDNKDCSKKVTEGNGLYGCGNGHSLSKFKYRYMVSMEISDMCGTAWVTLFDKAEAFFGKPAQEMGELQNSDPDAYKNIIDSKAFTMHNFRCRGRNETYQDVARVKFQAYDIRQVNFDQYGSALDNAIQKLEAL